METIPIRLPGLQPALLFPEGCRVRWSGPRPLSDLEHEPEVALASSWAEKVQELYAAGRLAAHRALEDLGCQSGAIGREGDGAPLWPKGVVGSITHTKNMALAVVSNAEEVLSLGIDVEKKERSLDLGLVDRVSTSGEATWIREKESESEFRLLRLLSAKEAIFKAISPLAGIRLGFLEADLKEKKSGFTVDLIHPRVSKEWPNLKFLLNQGLWKGYLVSALCVKEG